MMQKPRKIVLLTRGTTLKNHDQNIPKNSQRYPHADH